MFLPSWPIAPLYGLPDDCHAWPESWPGSPPTQQDPISPKPPDRRITTCPRALICRWFRAASAQKRFVRHTLTWGPLVANLSVQVTASGSPSPVGLTTVGLSIRVLPSAAMSLPLAASFHHSELWRQTCGPNCSLPRMRWGARQTIVSGSPAPVGVLGTTPAIANITGCGFD